MLARALLGASLLVLLPHVAFAQVTPAASAQAAELFEQGRALIEKKDFRAACPKFVDSAQLEPKVGTLLNLADCEEHVGQIVAARGHWQDAASLAHSVNDEREAVARQRFTALDPRVAKLTVTLASSAPTGLRVTRDGVELGAGSLGAALPVDPGPHTVVASAPGYADRSYAVTLKEGEAKGLDVEAGLKTPASVGTAAPVPAESSSWSGRKTVAVVTAGAGVAGVVVGSIFGVLAMTEYSSSNSLGCTKGSAACSTAGVGERDTAYHNGNVSTVAFVAGGALIATGAVLWIASPSGGSPARDSAPGVAMVLGPGSLGLRGVFE